MVQCHTHGPQTNVVDHIVNAEKLIKYSYTRSLNVHFSFTIVSSRTFLPNTGRKTADWSTHKKKLSYI